ncbi:hypothetical protein ABBQ38_005512 [Trebouxia sp. C0009 RCD-2024]
MELEPMYCAEQIKVPPNLADVLKAYTKEVIRQQPADILQFSAKYFAHLSKASDLTSDFIPPTVSQIRQVNVQLRANQLLPAAQLLDLCKGTGVHEGTLKKVWQLGNFGTDAKLNPTEVLMLMLTMTANELPTVFNNMFRAFGGEGARLETPTFVQLVTLLSKWDKSLTVQRCNALKESFDGSESLVFKDVQNHAVFQDLMSTSADVKAPES